MTDASHAGTPLISELALGISLLSAGGEDRDRPHGAGEPTAADPGGVAGSLDARVSARKSRNFSARIGRSECI
jgi:hypothetical protein